MLIGELVVSLLVGILVGWGLAVRGRVQPTPLAGLIDELDDASRVALGQAYLALRRERSRRPGATPADTEGVGEE